MILLSLMEHGDKRGIFLLTTHSYARPDRYVSVDNFIVSFLCNITKQVKSSYKQDGQSGWSLSQL